jgi:carboxyl-terminal processing protease
MRVSLRKPVLALALVLGLGACADSEPPNVDRVRPIIVDGLDINAMNTVFVHGYGEIKARAIEDPDVDGLFEAALAGFTKIDPDLSIAVKTGHIKVAMGDHPGIDAGPAPHDNIALWSRAMIKAILIARKISPEMHPVDEETLYQAAFVGSLSKIDPYSKYSTRIEASRNRLVRDGVIGLGIRVDAVDDGARVQALVTEGPADMAGVNISDVITAADGRSLAKMPLAEMRRLLDGSSDSTVTLTLKRAGSEQPIVVTAKRELIVPDTVKAKVENGVAELHVSSFNQRTAAAVERAVLKAKDDSNGVLKGIIIDFRSDPGGLLDQAVDMSSLFLDSGTIISLNGRHPGAKQFYAAHSHDIVPGVPIAIIVDGRTASAAEIVTAALQDNGRAVVIGTGTLGKGSVQTVVRLANGGELALTWAHSWTPRGAALHGLGILPDVCLAGFPKYEQAISYVTTTPNPSLETRQRWRFPVDDAASHAALRSACPAEAHLDRDVDTDIAKLLLKDHTMMARAVHPEAPQLAGSP